MKSHEPFQSYLGQLAGNFEIKMMVKIYAIEIIFRSHDPFQSYLLTGQADSAKKAG